MDFLTYTQRLSPSVLSVPIMGHLNTLDGYGRATTITGSPIWQNPTNQGFGFYSNGGGFYQIADGPEQDFTDQTIFVYFNTPFRSSGAIQRFLTKDDGVGRAWLFQASGTDYLYLYNSALSSQNAISSGITMVGYNSCAVRSISNTNVDFFQNGGLIDANAGLDFSSQPNADLYIGAASAGIVPCVNPIAIVAIFPSALTNEQIGLLHYYATKIRYGYRPKTFLYIPEKDTKGAVIDLWGNPNKNNIIADRSGNGNDITLTGLVAGVSDGIDKKLSFHGKGQGRGIVSSSTSIDNLSSHTYQFAMYQNSAGESNFGRIFSKGDKHLLYNSGANYFYAVDYSDGFGIWQFPVQLNQDVFIQLQHNHSDATNLPVCYMNGAPVTVSVNTAKTGAKDSDSGLDLLLGNRVALDRTSDMLFNNFKYFPTKLSAADLRDEYVKFARKHVIRHTSRYQYPVTLGAKSAPNNVGPWHTYAGSHEWLDDGNGRYIKHNNINAYTSMQCDTAYGAWYFKYSYTEASNIRIYIPFIATDPDSNIAGASQFGYVYQHNQKFGRSPQLFTMDGGGFNPIGTGGTWFSAEGQTVEAFITRQRTDGKFIVYLKDNSHSTFQEAFNVVDNTYTTCRYFNSYVVDTAPLSIHEILCWPYGDTLLPSDIPEI